MTHSHPSDPPRLPSEVDLPEVPAPVDDPASSPAEDDGPVSTGSSAELLLAQLAGGEVEENRRFRRSIVWAVVIHAAFFLFTFPELKRDVMYEGSPSKVFVMQQTRFKKPPAKAAPAKQEIPKKKAKKIPIPDPTPDEPEPIEIEEFDIPDLEPSDVLEVTFGIPDAPEPSGGQFGTARYDGDALQVGNGVGRPVPVHRFEPPYTEEARQRRIQGVVILQGIIDEKGDVRNLQVVKGLPFGLERSTLETVYQWKYKPATFEGKPVAVHQLFTINFSLQ